jgi:acetolactate synthase-1/2/3 large subunit
MPQFVIEQISEACRDAIIVTEVGQHQMWSAQFFKYSKPRTFLTSGGLGTMGYGFPAAMGAKVGRPDKTVINIAGDGSFQMNSQELATVVQNDIPVVNVILNNGYLGMVRQWQELFYDRRYSYTFIKGSVDFVKLAEAYGALGLRAEKPPKSGPQSKRRSVPEGQQLLKLLSNVKQMSTQWFRQVLQLTRSLTWRNTDETYTRSPCGK